MSHVIDEQKLKQRRQKRKVDVRHMFRISCGFSSLLVVVSGVFSGPLGFFNCIG